MSFEFKKDNLNTKNSPFLQNLIKWLRDLGNVSLKEKLFFIQNLKVMVKSGLSLASALKTLSLQTNNKKFKKIIQDLKDSTEKGLSFADSLQKHQHIFGDLFINMVKAGEASGRLDDVLNELFKQMKKDHDLRAKIKGAMTYPVIVLVAMVGIGTAMMIFVIPKLITVFEEMNAQLPFFTRLLISFTNLVVHRGWLLLIIIFIAAFLLIIFLRTKSGIHTWCWLTINLPIFGPISKKVNLARFTRTISSLIKTDIPIVQSFKITANVLGNVYYQEALYNSSERLVKGESISKILDSFPKLFPPVVREMTAVGEETGAVDDILDDLATFYEEDIDEIMKNLPSIIEPILMVVLGFGVGIMAVAIIMPMYSLTQNI